MSENHVGNGSTVWFQQKSNKNAISCNQNNNKTGKFLFMQYISCFILVQSFVLYICEVSQNMMTATQNSQDESSNYSLNSSSRLNGISIPLHFDFSPALQACNRMLDIKNETKEQQQQLQQNKITSQSIQATTKSSISTNKSDDTAASTTKTVPDAEIIRILNQFVFFLFLIYIVSLNLLGLWIFPYYVREPLTIHGRG